MTRRAPDAHDTDDTNDTNDTYIADGRRAIPPVERRMSVVEPAPIR